MIDIAQMTKEDFQKVPSVELPQTFTSFVIVPTGQLHESGWGCMKFVLLNKSKIIGSIGGYSDVIHIDGIGGYGRWDGQGWVPKEVPPKSWAIDCLPCGYLRVFAHGELSTDDWFGSDFEVYCDMK